MFVEDSVAIQPTLGSPLSNFFRITLTHLQSIKDWILFLEAVQTQVALVQAQPIQDRQGYVGNVFLEFSAVHCPFPKNCELAMKWRALERPGDILRVRAQEWPAFCREILEQSASEIQLARSKLPAPAVSHLQETMNLFFKVALPDTLAVEKWIAFLEAVQKQMLLVQSQPLQIENSCVANVFSEFSEEQCPYPLDRELLDKWSYLESPGIMLGVREEDWIFFCGHMIEQTAKEIERTRAEHTTSMQYSLNDLINTLDPDEAIPPPLSPVVAPHPSSPVSLIRKIFKELAPNLQDALKVAQSQEIEKYGDTISPEGWNQLVNKLYRQATQIQVQNQLQNRKSPRLSTYPYVWFHEMKNILHKENNSINIMAFDSCVMEIRELSEENFLRKIQKCLVFQKAMLSQSVSWSQWHFVMLNTYEGTITPIWVDNWLLCVKDLDMPEPNFSLSMQRVKFIAKSLVTSSAIGLVRTLQAYLKDAYDKKRPDWINEERAYVQEPIVLPDIEDFLGQPAWGDILLQGDSHYPIPWLIYWVQNTTEEALADRLQKVFLYLYEEYHNPDLIADDQGAARGLLETVLTNIIQQPQYARILFADSQTLLQIWSGQDLPIAAFLAPAMRDFWRELVATDGPSKVMDVWFAIMQAYAEDGLPSKLLKSFLMQRIFDIEELTEFDRFCMIANATNRAEMWCDFFQEMYDRKEPIPRSLLETLLQNPPDNILKILDIYASSCSDQLDVQSIQIVSDLSCVLEFALDRDKKNFIWTDFWEDLLLKVWSLYQKKSTFSQTSISTSLAWRYAQILMQYAPRNFWKKLFAQGYAATPEEGYLLFQTFGKNREYQNFFLTLLTSHRHQIHQALLFHEEFLKDTRWVFLRMIRMNVTISHPAMKSLLLNLFEWMIAPPPNGDLLQIEEQNSEESALTQQQIFCQGLVFISLSDLCNMSAPEGTIYPNMASLICDRSQGHSIAMASLREATKGSLFFQHRLIKQICKDVACFQQALSLSSIEQGMIVDYLFMPKTSLLVESYRAYIQDVCRRKNLHFLGQALISYNFAPCDLTTPRVFSAEHKSYTPATPGTALFRPPVVFFQAPNTIRSSSLLIMPVLMQFNHIEQKEYFSQMRGQRNIQVDWNALVQIHNKAMEQSKCSWLQDCLDMRDSTSKSGFLAAIQSFVQQTRTVSAVGILEWIYREKSRINHTDSIPHPMDDCYWLFTNFFDSRWQSTIHCSWVEAWVDRRFHTGNYEVLLQALPTLYEWTNHADSASPQDLQSLWLKIWAHARRDIVTTSHYTEKIIELLSHTAIDAPMVNPLFTEALQLNPLEGQYARIQSVIEQAQHHYLEINNTDRLSPLNDFLFAAFDRQMCEPQNILYALHNLRQSGMSFRCFSELVKVHIWPRAVENNTHLFWSVLFQSIGCYRSKMLESIDLREDSLACALSAWMVLHRNSCDPTPIQGVEKEYIEKDYLEKALIVLLKHFWQQQEYIQAYCLDRAFFFRVSFFIEENFLALVQCFDSNSPWLLEFTKYYAPNKNTVSLSKALLGLPEISSFMQWSILSCWSDRIFREDIQEMVSKYGYQWSPAVIQELLLEWQETPAGMHLRGLIAEHSPQILFLPHPDKICVQHIDFEKERTTEMNIHVLNHPYWISIKGALSPRYQTDLMKELMMLPYAARALWGSLADRVISNTATSVEEWALLRDVLQARPSPMLRVLYLNELWKVLNTCSDILKLLLENSQDFFAESIRDLQKRSYHAVLPIAPNCFAYNAEREQSVGYQKVLSILKKFPKVYAVFLGNIQGNWPTSSEYIRGNFGSLLKI